MTLRKESRETEDRAAAAAALATGGLARRIDKSGAGSGLRDFDLLFPDGRVEPLEVTSNTHRQTRETSARAGRQTSRRTTLSRTWLLALPSGSTETLDVERICRDVIAPLRVVEAHGVNALSEVWMHDSLPLSSAVRAIDALGVTGGTSAVPSDGIARLEFAVMYGDRVEVDTVAEAIEGVALREDNRAKLREPAGTSRRHLFVLLDWSGGASSWAARHAVEHGMMPRLPVLPVPITTAWVPAGRSVMYVTPPNQWQVAELPDNFEQHYRDLLTD